MEALKISLERRAQEELINFLKDLIQRFQLISLTPYVTACERQLTESNRIDIAVFGRFKAGKSSFLNHLVGHAVLPVAAIPLTAVITRLRYGPRETAIVEFTDGQKTTISVDKIADYVTEKGNPKNVKKVATLTVELPQLRPLYPLEFVDTPGLGSVFTHNSETTLSWLPNVRAAIIAVSVDAPLSEEDVKLIKEIKELTPRSVLLLTKADLLPEDQLIELEKFINDTLSEWVGTPVELYFYSIKPGYEHYRRQIITELFEPMIKDSSRAVREILDHKLHYALKNTRRFLELALSAIKLAEEQRAKLVKRLSHERENLKLFQQQLHLLAVELEAKLFEQTLNTLEPYRKRIEQILIEELEGNLKDWNYSIPKLLVVYTNWLKERLWTELKTLSDTNREIFVKPLFHLQYHLEEWLKGIYEKLGKDVKDILGLELPQLEFNLEVKPPESPPVVVGAVFDVAMEIVGYFIPRWTINKIIYKRILQQTQYEVLKNISRLVASWRERVAKAMNELEHQAIDKIDGLITTILEMALRSTQDISTIQDYIFKIDTLIGARSQI